MIEQTVNSREGVYISTYGCQMNVNDTERMYSILEMVNYEPVSRPEDASLIIINSCSVREKPVHKVWSEAGHYRKLKERNPKLRIGVGGCVAQQEKDKLLKDVPVLDFVFGTDNIDNLANIVGQLRAGDDKLVDAKFKHGEAYQIQTLVRNPGVSTYVNIMKGCDNFCTFCVVPFTRGRERSRDITEVLNDLNKLVDRGVQEVTLLGQNVNSYGSPCGANFANLLDRIARETGLKRIRFTSPHPKDFDVEVADTIAKHSAVIMENMHLPLQSGSSKILDRMNRGYSRDAFIAKAKMMQSKIPGCTFSTDIIVGFPGETEEDFQDTLSMLDEVAFEMIFAFKYSPRPFTKAAKYEDQLPDAVKKDRLARLLAKHRAQAYEMVKGYLGKELEVLVEEYHEHNNTCFGRSRQNKSVHIGTGNPQMVGQFVNVKIQEAHPQTLYGEVIQ